jgi:signal transduction histidine kinase
MSGRGSKLDPDSGRGSTVGIEQVERAHERRLLRLGFDVHDGPLQDLAMLAEDLRLLRRQLTEVLPADVAPLMLGRVDDLDAQVAGLDAQLRRISASVQSGLIDDRPLHEGLAHMTETFAARTGVRPRLRVEGELDGLTDSQRLALLSIIGEALNNAREHGRATAVEVSVRGGPKELRAVICDDGAGFDVEETLMRSAREGRLGLVGLNERARLLGGSCEIDSRPGGPTKIVVILPRWRPHASEPAADGRGG